MPKVTQLVSSRHKIQTQCWCPCASLTHCQTSSCSSTCHYPWLVALWPQWIFLSFLKRKTYLLSNLFNYYPVHFSFHVTLVFSPWQYLSSHRSFSALIPAVQFLCLLNLLTLNIVLKNSKYFSILYSLVLTWVLCIINYFFLLETTSPTKTANLCSPNMFPCYPSSSFSAFFASSFIRNFYVLCMPLEELKFCSVPCFLFVFYYYFLSIWPLSLLFILQF